MITDTYGIVKTSQCRISLQPADIQKGDQSC